MSTTFTAINKKQEGRSIYIKSNPVVGLLALTSLVDDNNGPQGPADFIKTFRYSINGVQYSNWIPLTTPNVIAITPNPTKPFIIEVAYFKNEAVGVSVLDVNNVTITADDQFDQETPFFDNSLFKKYFNANSTEVLNWYVNVLEKLWEKGLIPNYLVRDASDPDDFLALWSAVTRFFAYYVSYARTFSTFYNNYDLLTDFLQQRGLNVSPENSLPELQWMLQTFYYQMSIRGTNNIIKEGGDEGTGELKRLIHYKKLLDEFLWVLYKPENFGWCLGHSSPLYKGLRVNDSLNKASWSPGYTTMEGSSSYTSGGSISEVIDEGNLVLSFSAGILSATGIKMDPNVDYELSFQVKMPSTTKMNFSITGHDEFGNLINLISRKTGSTTGAFLTDAVISRDNDKYVTVRCYLYNQDRPQFVSDSTNIRQGQNIISISTLSDILFRLSFDGSAKVFDFKILPVQTDYSRGLIQVKNFISTWLINRNKVYSTKELEDYISRYLIPYNAHIRITNIGDYLYIAPEEPIDSTFWVGAGEYCQKLVWVGIDPSCEVSNLIWVPEEETAFCEQA